MRHLLQIDMAIAQENICSGNRCAGSWRCMVWYRTSGRPMEEVHKLSGTPENVKVFSMFALGIRQETRPQQNRFEPERIHFIENKSYYG